MKRLIPIQLSEQTAPSTPPANTVYLYVKSDGKIYIKDDAGTETDLTATGPGGSGGTIDINDGSTDFTSIASLIFNMLGGVVVNGTESPTGTLTLDVRADAGGTDGSLQYRDTSGVPAGDSNLIYSPADVALGVGKTPDGSASIDTVADVNHQGLRVEADDTTRLSFSTFVSGDSFVRFLFSPTGQLEWGDGGAVADVQLYRSDVGELTLAGRLLSDGFETAGGVELIENGTPSAPASDHLMLFARKMAGRMMPAFIGPSGLDSSLQPLIGRNSLAIFRAYPGATTVTAIGMTLSATGTATAQGNFASTNIYTSTVGVEYLVTTAATTAVAGFRVGTSASTMPYWRGNSAGLGGFTVIVRFGPATGVTGSAGTDRMFVGMSSSTGAPTDVNPSSLTNIIGVGYDSSDTNWQVLFNDGSGTATKVDTGIAVPSADRSNRYEVVIFCPPNGSTVYVQFTNLAPGGSTFNTSSSTDLPSATAFMGIFGYHSVGGTSSVVGFGLMSIYGEIDT